jgi:nitronate monooxygenase
METAFTKLVGCRVPLQQAGMGGTAGPELAIAVADAGGLGMLGLAGLPLRIATGMLERVASSTSGVFGANFLIPFLDRDAVAAAATRARVVEFFYGDPDASLVSLVHRQGALACWQVGSVTEAVAARDAGCDLVVAQGSEAGGHLRGQVGLVPLLEQVLGTLDVPVVAAGGIGGPRAVAAVLAAGAAAARVGTRFAAADEADTHDDYAKALVAAEPEDTSVTTTFSVGWPDAPHRVLRSAIDAAIASTEETVGEIELGAGHRVAVPRLSVMSPGRSATGNVAAMAHYAGQSVGMVRSRQPAAEIVHELIDGAERLLAHFS